MSEEYYSKSSIMNALLYNLSEAEAEEMMITIEVVGSADVAPVVHGRWLDDVDGKYYGRCFNCGKVAYKTPFCPYCGAKMDESEDKSE